MYCPNCGTKNEDYALFCEECGTSLKEYQDPVEEMQDENLREPESVQEEVIPEETAEENPEPVSEIPQEPEETPEPEEAPGEDTDSLEDLVYEQAIKEVVQEPEEDFEAEETFEDENLNYRDYDDDRYDDKNYDDDRDYDDDYDDSYDEEERASKSKEKKPRSKKNIFVIVEVLVAVVLAAAIVLIMNDRYSAEKVALNYWKAVQNCEWDKAYSYCSIPDSPLLSQQMYVNAHVENTEIFRYRSAKVRKSGVSQDSDVQTYTIEYLPESASDTCYDEIKLVKNGKKFLFWTDWEVVPENEWVSDFTFHVQSMAEIVLDGETLSKLDGVKVTEDDSDGGGKSVVVPYLFLGTHQLEVKADGMETYRREMTASDLSNGYGEVVLVADEETKEKIAEQYAEDLGKVLKAAADGKDFSEVEDLFAEDAIKENSIERKYKRLQEVTSGENPILSYKLSNLEIRISETYSGKMYLSVKMKLQTTMNSYFEGETNTYESSAYPYVTYVYEGDEWKLESMPIEDNDF